MARHLYQKPQAYKTSCKLTQRRVILPSHAETGQWHAYLPLAACMHGDSQFSLATPGSVE